MLEKPGLVLPGTMFLQELHTYSSMIMLSKIYICNYGTGSTTPELFLPS